MNEDLPAMPTADDSVEHLLSLRITPADREQRGRTRVIEDAVRLIRRVYDDAAASAAAVVHIEVTVRKPV